MSKLQFAFHIHSRFSKDGFDMPEQILNYCRKHQISAIAICDHNEIVGAKKLQSIAGDSLKVILCEEIKTTEGEIIGLFLSEKIEKGLGLEETINLIRQQNGLVCIPHPGELFRRSAIKKDYIEKIIDQVDIIEVFNARTLLNSDNIWAREIADKYHKVKIIGSDAHFANKISSAVMEIDDFSDANDFLAKLKNARIIQQKHSGIIDQILSKFVSLGKRLGIIKKY